MDKIKIVCSQIFYPVTMGWYMIRALQRRDDVEVFTVGPFTGNWIPWAGGMRIDYQYVESPDLPLPQNLIGTKPSFEFIKNNLPWKPDVWFQFDAGFHYATRPDAGVVALICTDPHALFDHYKYPRRYSDIVFNMQMPYFSDGDIYLPYAYDNTWLYHQDKEKKYDACAIGLQYTHREDLVRALRNAGIDVFYDIGLVYDDYREKYNESRLALSWSSLKDLPCRVWEGMGLKLPVITNRVPDLDHWFVNGEDYLGFDNKVEAVEKVLWALDNYDDALKIAENAHKKVIEAHTWDHRVEYMLEKVRNNL